MSDASGWAAKFVAGHKVYDGRTTHSLLDKLFEVRHRLIDIAGQSAVVGVEIRMPYSKDEAQPRSPGDLKTP